MEGWTKNGTDLEDPPVEWSVDRSQEMSSDGNASVRLHLVNVNDAGKIWMERSFDVEPNQAYKVRVSYDFASADYGNVNLWRIITGVLPQPPLSEKGAKLIFQEDTGNGGDSNTGYVWMDKDYTFTVESNDYGELYVNIGIWGNWETTRTYYVDDVKVSMRPISSGEVVTEEESLEIAREFVVNSPTYKFDGFDLQHKETLYPDLVDHPNMWTFIFEFKSRHAGYGDRTGENLLQVVTPHEAHITVDNGEVVSALLDLKWDMLHQRIVG